MRSKEEHRFDCLTQLLETLRKLEKLGSKGHFKKSKICLEKRKKGSSTAFMTSSSLDPKEPTPHRASTGTRAAHLALRRAPQLVVVRHLVFVVGFLRHVVVARHVRQVVVIVVRSGPDGCCCCCPCPLRLLLFSLAGELTSVSMPVYARMPAKTCVCQKRLRSATGRDWVCAWEHAQERVPQAERSGLVEF